MYVYTIFNIKHEVTTSRRLITSINYYPISTTVPITIVKYYLAKTLNQTKYGLQITDERIRTKERH